MSRFDSWQALQLDAPARVLVEASAGTGKTWTIAALYLRLLLEAGVTPRQVVVATFTNAAAAELRERLRRRLQQAERAADGDACASDAVDDWLAARWEGRMDRREDDLRRLRIALAELDMAPIGTLHGLCARILREHPFAAGGRFEPSELVDGAVFERELLQDLARTLLQGDEATLDALCPPAPRALLAGRCPDAAWLAPLLKPGLRIDTTDVDIEPPAGIAGILRAGSRDGLFGKNSKLPRVWREVADAVDAGDLEVITPEQCKTLLMEDGAKGVLKGQESDPDLLRALDASPSFARWLQTRTEYFQLMLRRHVRDWSLARKQAWMQRHDRICFDDLLGIVHATLLNERKGDARPLADALFAAWPVALVDEFQDTDDLQYGILDAIYRAADGTPRGRLLMVGDPKQAIYRFRGGDIHTYARASKEAGDHLALAVNQRSTTAYVEAVNAFFAAAGPALDANGGASGIAYLPVEAAGRADAHPYAIDGAPVERPLVIHDRAHPGDDKGRQVEDALEACAGQIAAMLADGRHTIGDRPLHPRDIAVLLPDNRQVTRLRTLLERRGVPCVSQGRDSVFAGDTARDLQVVLHGAWHAESRQKIRAALLTPLLGMSLPGLAALDGDADAWQAISLRFHDWRQKWRRGGVTALVDALIAEYGRDLLAREDGERILTDLRHLGELLQAQAGSGMGEGELLAWLAAQREGSGDSEEEREARQLRIESQSPRVRLLTLHASKGLEFPIVFLPLLSMHEGRDERGRAVTQHDPASGGRRLCIDARAQVADCREAQDERFRVLYVALTRAIHACHVFTVPEPERDERKGRRRGKGALRSPLDVLMERIGPKGRIDSAARIEWRTGWAQHPDAYYRAPEAAMLERPVRAMPAPPASPLPARHSFSSLSGGRHAGDAGAEAPAEDESTSAYGHDEDASDTTSASVPEPEHPALLALAKPRGTAIGNALHDVLEQRRIGEPLTAQLPLLESMLRARNLLPEGPAGVRLCRDWAERLDGALAVPLGDGVPALDTLAAADQRAEMEFHFALAPTSLDRLRAACAAHGAPDLVPASDRRIAGLMTGKIDLLFRQGERFHVLDYKGNFEGTRLSGYAPEALARVMDRHQYRFQALLYAVALDRYLRLRLPGYQRSRHLGEVCYLFLRAAGLAPGIGIWRHRYPDALIDAVDQALPSVEGDAA